MMNIIYAALSLCAQTEKTTFSCKDDCTLTKHTWRWTYSSRDFEIPLCHIPPLRSFYLILFCFSIINVNVSHGKAAPIKTYLAKAVCSAKTLMLKPLPDPVGHFRTPWWPFCRLCGIGGNAALQVMSECPLRH